VVVTSIVSVTDRVPSLTVKMQWPAATGVTLNVPLPLDGETVAMPLHEFVVPLAAVLTVNVPLKPVSVAVKFCAAPPPVAMNAKAEGVGTITDELGVGDGVGATETVEAVPPGPLHAGTTVPSASAIAKSQSRDVTNRPREARVRQRRCL